MIYLDKDLDITNKFPVIYTPDSHGYFPHNFNKSIILSNIKLDFGCYICYTDIIYNDFNMKIIPDDVLQGLQFFNVVTNELKKYNKFGVSNLNSEKIIISLTNEESQQQIISMRFVAKYIGGLRNDGLIKDLSQEKYGEESISWPLQILEATKILNDDDENLILVPKLAEMKMISNKEMSEKILKKSNDFNKQLTELITEKKEFLNIIQNTTTVKILKELINKEYKK